MGARQSAANFRRLIGLMWLVAVTLLTPAQAQNEFAERDQAERFQDMVVRVLPQPLAGTTAAASQGFGLIVGEHGQDLLVATPRHVVFDGDFTDRPRIRFRSNRFTDVEGRRFQYSSEEDDLAFIEVPTPAGMNPLHVTTVPSTGLNGQFVWGIGSGEDWRITTRAGGFEETLPNGKMRFGGLITVPGSSGGAIVTTQGVAAMILRTTGVGADTFALPVSQIQKWATYWQRDANLLAAPAAQPPVPTPPAATLPPAAKPSQAQPAAFTVMRDGPDYPEMVLIPGGTFTMGVPESESKREGRGANDDVARPLHSVTIESFWLGRYLVTRSEYAAFVSDRRYTEGGDSWRNPGFVQTERDPVVYVSAGDSEAYASWLAAKTGKPYRLPSEAEWEYAARAGTTTARFWGNDTSQACRFANVADETLRKKNSAAADRSRYFDCNDGYAMTSPVGSFQPNGFKLYDMLGNVWQWTADCYSANYDGAPTNGARATTGDCSRRVLRGGAWINYPWLVRAGYRFNGDQRYRGDLAGFRVARASP
jgi:formylglycine-generating enzyme required for sulfatase activity